LWLETTLPDEAARHDILSDHLRKLPAPLDNVDAKLLAAETDQLTGADLRRLVEDGKILYAYDRSRKIESDDILGYFQKAVETIRTNKKKYLEAEEKSRAKNAVPDPYSFLRSRRDYGGSEDTPA
jgi:ATP-dependent 26S proteasome regulatory subunit